MCQLSFHRKLTRIQQLVRSIKWLSFQETLALRLTASSCFPREHLYSRIAFHRGDNHENFAKRSPIFRNHREP